jgi:ribonuclease E
LLDDEPQAATEPWPTADVVEEPPLLAPERAAEESGTHLYEEPPRERPVGPDESGEDPRRLRRRRRRRRGGRPAESPTSAESAGEIDESETSDREMSEDVVEYVEDRGVERASESEEEQPRRRRRRRRRGRGGDRPGEARAPEGERRRAVEADEPDADGDLDEDVEELKPEEPIRAVRYDDVPTWDEAISYLVRSRSEAPRGRNEAARSERSRGRGRRRPNRRTDSEARDDA